MKVTRALISVSDKTNLELLVKGLHKLGVEILSTGGTAKFIAGLGVPVTEVSDYTGFPEMLDGRVKTLHPKIHGGLLALRKNPEHMKQIEKHDIKPIDMVVVNLYPFERTVANPNVKLEEAIENIDIGGPSMLRSAAKNYKSVAVITNPDKYGKILDELTARGGSLSDETLADLAKAVFERTSEYDKAIYTYLSNPNAKLAPTGDFPQILNLAFEKVQSLRYGENPHQRAAFYRDKTIDEASVSTARQLQGKELSFNNILDLNAALEIVKEFKEPAASIIKHTNPCGAATADTLAKAYKDALECDKLSAFGSVVGLNKRVDEETAKAITSSDFVECVIAPAYEPKALELFTKKKNLRLLEVPNFDKLASKTDVDLKKVVGGLLLQDRDTKTINEKDLKIVTKAKPTTRELQSLLFGWKIAKHVKSNAIVLCKGTKTVGIGAGQMSRVDSVMIASRKAGKNAKGSTLASDAFFPKADGISQATKCGVVAIIQPGGSIKDEEVIKQADKAKIAMVFTGVRHFKH